MGQNPEFSIAVGKGKCPTTERSISYAREREGFIDRAFREGAIGSLIGEAFIVVIDGQLSLVAARETTGGRTTACEICSVSRKIALPDANIISRCVCARCVGSRLLNFIGLHDILRLQKPGHNALIV